MVILMGQVVEKMLKSVVEKLCTDANDTLKESFNLLAIYEKIHEISPNFILNRGDLSMLEDYYLNAGSPGSSFVIIDRTSCESCLDIMYTVLDEINILCSSLGLYAFFYEKKYLDNTDNSYMSIF